MRRISGFGLFLLFLFVIIFGVQGACNPWAHSTFGPTLIGIWMGEFTPASRGRHVVLLDLRDAISEDSDRDLAGTATICDARGEQRTFGVTGMTQNWRGTRFRFTTFIKANVNGEGVQLGEVDGDWDRGDTLRVSVKPRLWRIRNGGVFSSTDRSPEQMVLEDTIVPLTLTRATDRQFRAACEQLRTDGSGRDRSPR